MLHLSCLSPSPVLTSSSERIAEPLPYPKSLVPPQVSSFLTLTPYLVLQQILLALTPKHIHHVPPSHCHNAVSLLGKLLSHSAPHNSQGEILKCKQDRSHERDLENFNAELLRPLSCSVNCFESKSTVCIHLSHPAQECTILLLFPFCLFLSKQ